MLFSSGVLIEASSENMLHDQNIVRCNPHQLCNPKGTDHSLPSAMDMHPCWPFKYTITVLQSVPKIHYLLFATAAVLLGDNSHWLH